MLHIKLQGNWSTGSREEDFKGFYYEQVWWPCWSCDLDFLNKVLFSQPKEAIQEILLQLAQRLFRRCLK